MTVATVFSDTPDQSLSFDLATVSPRGGVGSAETLRLYCGVNPVLAVLVMPL